MYHQSKHIIRRTYSPSVVGKTDKLTSRQHAEALAIIDYTHFRRVGKGVEFYMLKDGSYVVDVYEKGNKHVR